jgi:hypothetical protein
MNGREGLVQAIERRSSTASLEGSVYSLADQSFSPVVRSQANFAEDYLS